MWHPQLGGQIAALEADWCSEIFFGGERGGGKSDFQIGYQEDGAMRYESAWRGIMFRKTYPEIEELQARALEIFPLEGAVFKTQPSAEHPFSNCWYWANGATVKMRYIENEKDYGRYHGHQYTGISFDEVTEYKTSSPILKMLSTLRSPSGVPCTMRATGNPGGVGHSWVKDRYIDNMQALTPFDDPETGFTRMFVPSVMTDNKALMTGDPTYKNRLLAATEGNDVLRKAWLEGDWDIVAGAALNIKREHHMLRPFVPLRHWAKFQVIDWGYVKPYAVGWFCVVDQDTVLAGKDGGSEVLLPKNAVVLYREKYGTTGKPNEGSREESDIVARDIIKIEEDANEIMDYRVADTSMWAKNDGMSIFERMFKATKGKFNPRQSIKDRQANYSEICSRLKGEQVQTNTYIPMFYATSNCLNFWRTVPTLALDLLQPEKGPDSDQEDHLFDVVSYGLMSRPFIRTKDQRLVAEFKKRRNIAHMDKVDPYRTKPLARKK